MKHLIGKNVLEQISGGASADCEHSRFEEFKQELRDLLGTSLDGIGDTADSMSKKINELIDKYNDKNK